jgi:hypothetical protein
MNRDLDAQIAEEIYGWTLFPVSADCDGENASEILAPYEDYIPYSSLPVKGKIGKAFLCPTYSHSLAHALELIREVKMPVNVLDMPRKPEAIALACLHYHRTKELPEWAKMPNSTPNPEVSDTTGAK